MTTNITINNRISAIVLSKKFEKLASRFGTDEYKQLQKARRDYPEYRVVVTAAKKSGEALKRITVEFMEKYIRNHDEDGSIMKEFEDLRGTSEEAKELEIGSESYFKIRKWFFNKYPAIERFVVKRENLVA